MKLSHEEETFFNSTFQNIKQSGVSFDETNCIRLLSRGIKDPATCSKIWNLVSEEGNKKTLDKDHLFRLLKYVAAFQQGYQIEEINLNELPELLPPILPKTKAKKKKKKVSDMTINPINEINQCILEKEVSSPIAPQLSEKINEEIEVSPQDKSSNRLRGQIEKVQKIEVIIEEKKLDEPKPAQEELPSSNNQINKEEFYLTLSEEDPPKTFSSPLNDKLDKLSQINVQIEEKVVKQKEMERKEVTSEESFLKASPKMNNFSLSQTPTRDSDVKKANESENYKRRRMKTNVEDLDSALITVGNFEQVEVPNFEENIQFSPIYKLVNPFKSETKDDSGADSSDNTTTSPKSHRKDTFDKSERDLHLPNFASSMGYTNYLEQNQKIRIEITQTKTNTSGILGYSTYVSYIIKSKYLESEAMFEAERRFSDFDWLNCYFRTNPQYKGLVFPSLPPKKSIGNINAVFIQQRRAELERYLKELSRHEILSKDPFLRIFLGDKNKEDFNSLRERKPLKGITIPQLDWQKIKEICEYTVANLKVKFKKENMQTDWSEGNDLINEIFRLDGVMNKMMKNLQKKQEFDKAFQTMNANLHITYTKIMNKVTDESYYALGSLSSLIVAQAGNVYEESIINEDFTRDMKILKSKSDCFKESYALLISTLEEIKTNRELNKFKQSKLFEYKADDNFASINSVTNEIYEIEKKTENLEKDIATMKENLSSEARNLFQEFQAFLPDILSEFYARQSEHLQKVSNSWKQISTQ